MNFPRHISGIFHDRWLALILVAGALALGPHESPAQDEKQSPDDQALSRRPALSFQLGGYSSQALHYDWPRSQGWRARVGLALWIRPILLGSEATSDDFPSALVGVPAGLRWRPGNGNWRFEAGLTLVPGVAAYDNSAGPTLWGGPNIGFGRQPLGGGLTFRVTGTLSAVAHPEGLDLMPGIGIEVGWAL